MLTLALGGAEGCLCWQGAAAAETLVLTPQKVRELFLVQGLEVQLLEAARKARAADLPQVRSRFDTELTLEADHNIDKSARSSTFFGSRTDTSRWNAGLEKLLPSGSTLGLRWLTEREQVTGASAVSGIPAGPTYEPALEFRLDQSIGENFFGRLDRAEVRRVEAAVEAHDFQTQHEIQKRVTEALSVFWEWNAAREALANGREALRAALDFYQMSLEKEKLGLVEKTGRLGAQSLTARRTALVKELESAVLNWEANLRSLLSLPVEPELVPRAGSVELPSLEREEAIRLALNRRFDLLSFKEALEEKDIKLSMAKGERLPTIDLKNTLTLNEVNVGSYTTALGGMDSPNWTVALQLSFPLENRGARGAKARADFEKLQALLKVKQLEETIVHDVNRKLAQAGLAREALKKKEEAEALEKQRLEAALGEYRRARFSAEQILQYQDDYLEAGLEAVKARRDFALAVLALREAMGVIASEAKQSN